MDLDYLEVIGLEPSRIQGKEVSVTNGVGPTKKEFGKRPALKWLAGETKRACSITEIGNKEAYDLPVDNFSLLKEDEVIILE